MSDNTIKLEGEELAQWLEAKARVDELLDGADKLASHPACTDSFRDDLTELKRLLKADGPQLLTSPAKVAGGLYVAVDELQKWIDQELDRIAHEEREEALREQVKPAKVKAYKPRKPKLGKIIDTPNPTLTRAVIKQVGGKDALIDVYNHGAMGGFCGFTYYNDTVPFFEKHRAAILEFLEESAEECGEEPVQMVMGFNCLRLEEQVQMGRGFDCQLLSDADREEQRAYRGAINRLLYSGRKVDWDRNEEVQVANALAWYALEEVSRQMVIE